MHLFWFSIEPLHHERRLLHRLFYKMCVFPCGQVCVQKHMAVKISPQATDSLSKPRQLIENSRFSSLHIVYDFNSRFSSLVILFCPLKLLRHSHRDDREQRRRLHLDWVICPHLNASERICCCSNSWPPPAAQGRNPEREGSCAEFPRWQAVFPVFWYDATTSSRPEIVNQRHCWGAPAAFPRWRRCCCSTSRCRPAPPPPPLLARGRPPSQRGSPPLCRPGGHQQSCNRRCEVSNRKK